ncbi:hypothetical protein Anapl_05291 [Anas platyrhynchos]|uniref:Uncharacterized protein n=1 Tax=Anas platyrhynchos TaxID=8839 RepID=R0KY32_ANAPL|nr:hypothetical protein Anapl_05291 [Anas platyrhynchos]
MHNTFPEKKPCLRMREQGLGDALGADGTTRSSSKPEVGEFDTRRCFTPEKFAETHPSGAFPLITEERVAVNGRNTEVASSEMLVRAGSPPISPCHGRFVLGLTHTESSSGTVGSCASVKTLLRCLVRTETRRAFKWKSFYLLMGLELCKSAYSAGLGEQQLSVEALAAQKLLNFQKKSAVERFGAEQPMLSPCSSSYRVAAAVQHDDTLRPPTFCIHLLISVTVLLRSVFRLARADQKLTVIWLILFPVGSIDCKVDAPKLPECDGDGISCWCLVVLTAIKELRKQEGKVKGFGRGGKMPPLWLHISPQCSSRSS